MQGIKGDYENGMMNIMILAIFVVVALNATAMGNITDGSNVSAPDAHINLIFPEKAFGYDNITEYIFHMKLQTCPIMLGDIQNMTGYYHCMGYMIPFADGNNNEDGA